jgi:hypothetical protein
MKSKAGAARTRLEPQGGCPSNASPPSSIPPGEYREHLLREYWITLVTLGRAGYDPEAALNIVADLDSGKLKSLKDLGLKEKKHGK